MNDQDPGDEHRERGYKLHRIWPKRNESFGLGTVANQLGAVVRCGDFVPLHWAVHVDALVECDGCKE